ncbi:MAG TPA: alpha/beta hydrolase [Acidobacteriota bacterium]|nr:alpha/beta hydrolase [Acidobacteriota bacterium]HQF88389.1 alpha/beta hydrolase [Acidobacteriota bacterium]HQG92912.1 alpha/beta hydrolase [Acidobacteriota bacterium]
MENLRTYGRPPYRVAVIHGGPGAPGCMAPVARELADAAFGDPGRPEADAAFARLGALATRADACDVLTTDTGVLAHQARIYAGVWPEMAELRRSGGLLELARSVRCPVTAIHGDCDSHPADGVAEPLAAVLPGFRFILLERCGHLPWLERHARDAFFQTLRAELRQAYPPPPSTV